MNKFLLILLTFFSICSQAQKKIKIPGKIKKSPELLAEFLTQDASTEFDKIDTIYSWITHKITYDYKKLDSDKPFSAETSKSVLKSKKAICTGYSTLLVDMLNSIGIASELVSGYIESSLKDSIVLPSYSSHAWVALKTGGQWYLADPTWDAGYVGSIPTNKKAIFEKKWKKHNTKFAEKDAKLVEKKENTNKPNKIDRLFVRIGKNEERRIKNFEKLQRDEIKAKAFTGKTGFVALPQKEWLMISPDSFLLNHLPCNPMWQLKKDTISCLTFAKGNESIKNYTSSHKNGKYAFVNKIKTYRKLDPLQKLLWSAEDAFTYNPNNFYTKAINYFNYVNIISHKKNSKLLPEAYHLSDYSQLLPYVDTANVYSKYSVKRSKSIHKFSKNYYKNLNKSDIIAYKHIKKSVDKGLKLNTKALKTIKTKNNSLRNQNHSLSKKLEKLNSEITTTQSQATETAADYLKDSLNQIINRFEQHKEQWQKTLKNKPTETARRSIMQNNYLLHLMNKYVALNNYNLNDYTDTIKNYLDSNNAVILRYYNDSLPLEILKKSLYNELKNMSSFLTYSKNELTALKLNKQISSIETIQNVFKMKISAKYDSLIHINRKVIENNILLRYKINQLSDYWDDTRVAEKKQKTLINDRYLLSSSEVNHDQERQKKNFKLITKKTTQWKLEFKPKK